MYYGFFLSLQWLALLIHSKTSSCSKDSETSSSCVVEVAVLKTQVKMSLEVICVNSSSSKNYSCNRPSQSTTSVGTFRVGIIVSL